MDGKRVGVWALLVCAVFGFGPALAADTDGDGVDDAVDCRPSDATTWSAPADAIPLILAGGASTTFHWSAPGSPGGTALLYDVIRATSAADFSAATCLVSNNVSTAPAFTDPAVPGQIFFYLVRAKTACGGNLGTKTGAIPRTGASCSTADGGSCSVDASCTGGWCCGGTCSNLVSDANNCGACGTPCIAQGGTNSCVASVCSPSCVPPNNNCDGNPNNGCETPTIDVTNCGACFNVCPGFGQPFDNVTCSGASTCTFSCQGEHYDVNNSASDGCEVLDSPVGNHTQAAANDQGSRTCTDSDGFSFNGKLVNDGQVHSNPAVSGFDSSSGSAPDWALIHATGGAFCTNDFSVTLQVNSTPTPTCYKLSVITNLFTATCQTSAAGSCTASHGSGGYSDGSTVLIEVQRTCSTGNFASAGYTVSGHL